MAVSPFEIIAGPAQLWLAATGTAFPVINATPSGSWTNLGRTDGGIQVSFSQNVELLMYDQSTSAIKAIRTEQSMEIGTQLVDMTLENWGKALNNNTITSAAGPPAIKYMYTYQTVDVAQFALLCRGSLSPYGNFNLQFEVPVVSQIDEPEVEFTREDKAVLNVRFVALDNPAAATEAERFGRIVAQTA